MSYSEKLTKVLKYPKKLLDLLGTRGCFHKMPDKAYLQRQYYARMGKALNIDKPKAFSEKLQWLKINDRNPEYTQMVDKYKVRQHIAEKLGKDYLIPLLGVWENFDHVDFDGLPNQFVLKSTHDSGGVLICQNKSEFERGRAKRIFDKRLKNNYYWPTREWVYKSIAPRIIAEQYMVDETGAELKDYKLFNFNGEPRLIQVDFNRFTGHKRNLYTTSWEPIDVRFMYPSDPNAPIVKPLLLDKMLDCARTLSKGIPFVRSDFYSIHDRLYFGELTFYPEAGYTTFSPEVYDDEIGNWLALPPSIDVGLV